LKQKIELENKVAELEKSSASKTELEAFKKMILKNDK